MHHSKQAKLKDTRTPSSIESHAINHLCHFFCRTCKVGFLLDRVAPPPSRRCHASVGMTQPRVRLASRFSAICGSGIHLSFPSGRMSCLVIAPGPPTFKCPDGWVGKGVCFESIIRKYNARLTVIGPLRTSRWPDRSGDSLREAKSEVAGEWR